jgi:hypothetical protein
MKDADQPSPALEILTARVAALERRGRRAVFAAVALAIAAPLGIAATGTPPGIVDAGRFVLRGPDGAERGVWEVREGDARLVLRDAAGEERFVLAIEGGRPAMTVFDSGRRPRVRLVVAHETSLNFYDRGGKLRAALGVTSYGPHPLDAERLRSSGRALFDFFDPGWLLGEDDLSDSIEDSEGPVLKFYDPAGKPRLEARVDVDRPVVFLHSPAGTMDAIRPK